MLRALIAIVLGAFVASGLLFLMQALIASGQTAIVDKPTSRIVDFVRVKREERLESKRSKPNRPPHPDEGRTGQKRVPSGSTTANHAP